MKPIYKLMLAGAAAIIAIVAIVQQNKPFHFPPVPISPVPVPNAYDDFRKAADGAKRDEIKVKIPLSLMGVGYTGYPAPLQGAIVKATEPDLNLMRAGFGHPYSFPNDHGIYTPGLRYMGGFRELARLLQLQGLVDQRNGDYPGAAGAYLDSIELGVDIPHGGPIICPLVGAACESIGRGNLWPILSHLTYAQTQAAKARLLAIEASRTPYADAEIQEKYDRQVALQTMMKPRDWAYQVADSEMDSYDVLKVHNSLDRLLFEWRLRIAGKRTIYNQYSAYQDAVIEAARKPYGAHSLVRHVPLDPITAFEDSASGIDPYSFNLMARERVVDSQTQNACLIVALALQQYYLTNHNYPKSLSELVPTYLPAIPADPFALSGPLRYIQFRRTYCLYSVGPDGVDNHGAAIGAVGSSVRSYVEFASKGDVVAGVNP